MRGTQLEAQLATAQADLLASTTSYNALASDNMELSGRVTDLEADKAHLQSSFNQAIEELQAAKTRADAEAARATSLTGQVADLQAQVEALQAQINTPAVP